MQVFKCPHEFELFQHPSVEDLDQQTQLRTASLSTLLSLLEWVGFDVLLDDQLKLLPLLCTLLRVEPLKTQAAECLLVLLARKVKGACPERRGVWQ